MNYKDIPDKDRIMKQSIRDANEEQRKMMTKQNILESIMDFCVDNEEVKFETDLKTIKKSILKALSQQKAELVKEIEELFDLPDDHDTEGWNNAIRKVVSILNKYK